MGKVLLCNFGFLGGHFKFRRFLFWICEPFEFVVLQAIDHGMYRFGNFTQGQLPLIAQASYELIGLMVIVQIKGTTIWRVILICYPKGTDHPLDLLEVYPTKDVHGQCIIRIGDKVWVDKGQAGIGFCRDMLHDCQKT